MISKNTLDNLVQKLHLENFIKSQKIFLEDNRGGFLILLEVKIKDKEFARYRHLPIYWSISPITRDDLPDEFSQKAVNVVDMFRRKTHDLDCECLIYFDIVSGNIVSCNFSDGNNYNVSGIIFPDLLKSMHIASIHNHPRGYYSPPSGKNFEMLGLEFEEYELILSEKELWILESREVIFSENEINEIRRKVDLFFNLCFDDVNHDVKMSFDVLDNSNKLYGFMLLNYFNNKFDNIKLTMRVLNE